MDERQTRAGLAAGAPERLRHQYVLQAIRVPLMRLFGFVMIGIAVALHNRFILGTFTFSSWVVFYGGLLAYCLTSWFFLHVYYRRPRSGGFDVAWIFHALDVVACMAVICYSGGEKSWLFFIVLVPVWNQTYFSARRAFLSGLTASVAYLVMLLALRNLEQRPIEMQAVAIQASLILIVAAYCTLTASIVERDRRRYTEELRSARNRAERNATQLAALNRMTRSVTTNAELQPMLDAAAGEVLTLLRASSCAITMLDRRTSTLEVAACRSIRADAPDVRGFRFATALNPACHAAINTGKPVVVADAQHSPLTAVTHEALRALNVQCLMSVPIIIGGEVIGTVSVHTDDAGRLFTEEEGELAAMAAAQVAAPIKNAQLYQEEKRSRELAERLQSAGRAITSSLDLDQVLAGILHHMHEVISFEGGSIQLLEEKEEGRSMRVVAVHGYEPREVGRTRLLADYPFNRALAEREQPVILTMPDPLLRDDAGEFLTIETVMGVPLIVNDRVIGAMVLDSPLVHAYDENDAAAAMAFARFASIAVEHARLYSSVQELSILDPLTGVFNRRHFDDVLQTEWRRAARNGAPFAVLMIDVDNFKAYNDHYGHRAGDRVLQQVAAEMMATFQRAGDLVARYGGEEFIVLLAGADSNVAAMRAEMLRWRVEQLRIPHEALGAGGVVTISVGVASTVPASDNECGELIGEADDELYQAKRSGRNRVASPPRGARLPIKNSWRTTSRTGPS